MTVTMTAIIVGLCNGDTVFSAHRWRARCFFRGSTGLVTDWLPLYKPTSLQSRSRAQWCQFGPPKKQPTNKGFANDADMKQAVTSWLQTLHTVFFYTNILFLTYL